MRTKDSKTAVIPSGVVKYLYRRKEAAFALGMSLRRIDYMIADKVLTTRKVGGTVVIPAADVDLVAQKIIKGDTLSAVAIGCNQR
jgi:hypothetical protein